MDNQLKHRLTGATILVLLIVLLVPEMLSGPQPAVTPAMLPAGARTEDVPIRSFDINVSERESAPAQAADPAAAAPTPAARPVPQAATATRPAGEAPASSVAPTSPPSSTPSPRPAVAPPRGGVTGTYFVQLGSFSARNSASNLAARLKSSGFSATVTPVTAGGRTLHRVRVGPVGDRAAGEALAKRLRAAGHVGSVVSGP